MKRVIINGLQGASGNLEGSLGYLQLLLPLLIELSFYLIKLRDEIHKF